MWRAIRYGIKSQHCGRHTDLVKEVRHFGDVADIIRGQFHRNDFMRASIDSEM